VLAMSTYAARVASGCARVAAAAGSAAASAQAAASSVSDFVRQQQVKWDPENRPCDHPFDCDFRIALGMSPDATYTDKDIQRHERQATRWWHPDRNGGVDRGFEAFKTMADLMKVARLRRRYAEAVRREKEATHECNESIRWRVFNIRFVKQVQPEQRIFAEEPQGAPSASEEVELCHVFLDHSFSMDGDSLEKGVKAFQNLFPRFVMTPTAIHLVGDVDGPNCSRLLVSHGQELRERESDVLSSWTAAAGSTYLWHYIYKQVEPFKELKHEVIIITDGEDNSSPEPFGGLLGFNEMMSATKGSKIRISLYLIGNSFGGGETEDVEVYRDLCLATGGLFHHEQDDVVDGEAMAMTNFTAPLLWPEGERDILARGQQATYQQMLRNGEARPFDWCTALGNGDVDGPHCTASPTRKRKPSPSRRDGNSSLPLALRSKVRIAGLVRAPQLNGEVGVCEAFLSETGRWQVKLDSGLTKALLPENLEVLQASRPTKAGRALSSQVFCTEL